MTRGRFIVFEGIDGSGKSTQARHLAQRLRDQGLRVHLTAEPTSGPVGSLIRNGFSGRVVLDDRVIAALFVADRIDHLTNSHDGMLRLLDDGVTIISDRYYLSSVAYHSSDVAPEWVINANALSTDLLRPDLTIFLRLAPEVASHRMVDGGKITDRFEGLEKIADAATNYELAVDLARELDTIVCIDADAKSDVIANQVLEAVEKHLPDIVNKRSES